LNNPELSNQLEPVESPATVIENIVTTIENIVTTTPIPELPPKRKLDDNWQVIGLAEDLMKSTALNAMEVTSQSITVYEMRHQRDPKAQNQWCRQR